MRRATATAVLLMTVASSVGAHVTVSGSFPELVAESTMIVRGLVTDVRGVLDSRGSVSSVVSVAVEETLKGDAVSFVSVRVPGGVVGRRRVVMVGAPRFRPGDRAFWFLVQDEDGVSRPIGLAQGVYRLAPGTNGVSLVVEPPLVASPAAAGERLSRGDSLRRPMPASEFESLVRLLLAGPAAPRVRTRP